MIAGVSLIRGERTRFVFGLVGFAFWLSFDEAEVGFCLGFEKRGIASCFVLSLPAMRLAPAKCTCRFDTVSSLPALVALTNGSVERLELLLNGDVKRKSSDSSSSLRISNSTKARCSAVMLRFPDQFQLSHFELLLGTKRCGWQGHTSGLQISRGTRYQFMSYSYY